MGGWKVTGPLEDMAAEKGRGWQMSEPLWS